MSGLGPALCCVVWRGALGDISPLDVWPACNSLAMTAAGRRVRRGPPAAAAPRLAALEDGGEGKRQRTEKKKKEKRASMDATGSSAHTLTVGRGWDPPLCQSDERVPRFDPAAARQQSLTAAGVGPSFSTMGWRRCGGRGGCLQAEEARTGDDCGCLPLCVHPGLGGSI